MRSYSREVKDTTWNAVAVILAVLTSTCHGAPVVFQLLPDALDTPGFHFIDGSTAIPTPEYGYSGTVTIDDSQFGSYTHANQNDFQPLDWEITLRTPDSNDGIATQVFSGHFVPGQGVSSFSLDVPPLSDSTLVVSAAGISLTPHTVATNVNAKLLFFGTDPNGLGSTSLWFSSPDRGIPGFVFMSDASEERDFVSQPYFPEASTGIPIASVAVPEPSSFLCIGLAGLVTAFTRRVCTGCHGVF